jgi:type IV pilus assembly protein PilX
MRENNNVLESGTGLHPQRGAVLIVALLFLVILTMLGVTAMSGTMMEERMSGNSRDVNIALQAAEAALRDARRDINRLPINGAARDMHMSKFGDPSGTVGTCSSVARGLCRPIPPTENGSSDAIMPPTLNIDAQPYATYGQFTGAPAIRATVGGTHNAALATQPRYLVELFCLSTRTGQDSMGAGTGVYCKFYRITARGYGVNPNSQVTLQEIFLSL